MPLTLEEIEKILQEALPRVAKEDIHKPVAALRKVMGGWQEVDLTESLGAMLSVQCRDICAIGKAYEDGFAIRAFIAPKKDVKS